MEYDQEKRFVASKAKIVGTIVDGAKVIVDRETGVQYLFYASGYAGGLTVLVGADGKPLVDPHFGNNQYGY